MALIALRSPQFKFINIPIISTAVSAKCVITIDSTQRYVLTKNSKRNNTVNFDISELARDYLEITYDPNYVPQTIAIVTTLSIWDGLNATGTQVGSDVVFTDTGFEAYGEYEDGTNPQLPPSSYLISGNPDACSSTGNDSVDIYYPLNTSGKIPLSNAYAISVQSFSTISIIIGTQYPSTISRIGCTKYGDGRKIIFINKFGVQQDLWFFLKETKTLSRKNEGYKANTLTFPNTDLPAQYSVTDAPNKVFNTTAKQSFTLSSGYYPEQANQFFEELLLSEYVWLERPKAVKNCQVLTIIVPVKVKKSSIKFKTSVNDRLIEYTMDFEEAFDYINNIR